MRRTSLLAILMLGGGTISAVGEVSLMALAPANLYSGGTGSLTITAVNAEDRTPAEVMFSAWLETTNGGNTYPLVSGSTGPQGRYWGIFATPEVEPGAYRIKIQGPPECGVLQSNVSVRSLPVLFLETDKPIYKPGQTIQGRVLLLNNQLLPGEGTVDLTIADAKGIRMFHAPLETNGFGVAPFELPLATELNFGTWKLTAQAGSSRTAVDVKVEKYVLPKLDLDIATAQEYFLVSDRVQGSISAFYFFGQPVEGTAEIRASRYVGTWEEYASYTGTLENGLVSFDFPPVNYVSGTPSNGGAGNLLVELTVTDTSGHAETYSEFFRIPQGDLQIQVIPLVQRVIPSTDFTVAVTAQDAAGETTDCAGTLYVQYAVTQSTEGGGSYMNLLPEESHAFTTANGIARATLTAPKDVLGVSLKAATESGERQITATAFLFSAYSPSSSFISLIRNSGDPVAVGETVSFDLLSPQASTVYYDVFAAGRTVFSGYVQGATLSFQTTPAMSPQAEIVAYVINPDGEVSADSASFTVTATNSALSAWFSAEQVFPGAPVQVGLNAGTEAMIGVSVVDESVYALNQGRLNLRDVFEELENAYMAPHVETHPSGAYDILTGAGLCVMTSGMDVPQGPAYDWLSILFGGEGEVEWENGEGAMEHPTDGGGDLAEVTRVRQFFPETWVWNPELLTDSSGNAHLDLTAPDSITTWKLHAVSTSEQGVGIADAELVVFQEFFGEPDLPYAVTRGETFPVRVQIYNYLDTPQTVQVDLTAAPWFEMLEESSKTVSVEANSVSLASFLIRPVQLGTQTVEVTLRSTECADAVRKSLIVQPEGTTREWVENGDIEAGETLTVPRDLPAGMVSGSGKVLLSLTPSIAAQCMNGLDNLLNMPCGCGEQNMIYAAPDVQVLKYLDATGQAAPEVRAKAEQFINVGYQRQLTYQRTDGSFSAFGDDDPSGSLWLTAFVLKVFSGARDIIAVDDALLAQAAAWVQNRQNPDGSWEPYGFLYHADLVGGNEGVYPLTAYIALALHAFSPSSNGLGSASAYLAGHLTEMMDNPYALAIGALAMQRMGNPASVTAAARLLDLAQSDEHGLYWTPAPIETTAYAILALIETGQTAPVNEAVAWLAAQRNSLGGYTSTQDTVMAIEALLMAATGQNRDLDLLVTARETTPASTEGEKQGAVIAQFAVNTDNFDVLQQVEIPPGEPMELTAEGSGRVNFQVVRKFNVMLPSQTAPGEVGLDIEYSATHVEVDDLVDVNVKVTYNGTGTPSEQEYEAETTPEPQKSGMMLIDVGVPTGFAPVAATLDLLKELNLISRYEIAGRKVILYILDMTAGQTLDLSYQVLARFPVRALTPDSYAYRYYAPDARDEVKGQAITIALNGNLHIQSVHTADQDGDSAISLPELLRIIQFFNAGAYQCWEGTEDGFAPGEGSPLCTPHAVDYAPQDWRVNLRELLRAIQFYNMGGYLACPDAGTEDGYCPKRI